VTGITQRANERKEIEGMPTEGWTANEKFDWDNVSTDAPPPLEDGVYQAVIVKASAEKTKDGKPAVRLELQVNRAFGDAEGSIKRKMFDNLTVTLEGAFRIKNLCESFDPKVTPPPSQQLDDVKDFCSRLLEAPAIWLRSRRTTWNGKVNAKVDRYLTEAEAQKVSAGEPIGNEVAASDVGNGSVAAKTRRRRA
jgi:uncharacterized protein DUF669